MQWRKRIFGEKIRSDSIYEGGIADIYERPRRLATHGLTPNSVLGDHDIVQGPAGHWDCTGDTGGVVRWRIKVPKRRGLRDIEEAYRDTYCPYSGSVDRHILAKTGRDGNLNDGVPNSG